MADNGDLAGNFPSYILFYNNFSLCSLMVRFTLALCNECPGTPLNVEEKHVDIQHGGQLTEEYICDVNPKGTVPVLIKPIPHGTSMTESLDMTLLLCQIYPSLCPPHLSIQIRSLLGDLHAINYFSLTYTHVPQRVFDLENMIKAKLANPGIPERYREALELKLELVRNTRVPALDPAIVQGVEDSATMFLSKIKNVIESSQVDRSPWMFGTKYPTALDAHVVPFIARLLDVGRERMLGDTVRLYAENIFQEEAWRKTMQGRKTVFSKYL